MRKTIITIIAGFIIAITSPFIAIAANDTPHNTSKTVSCGNCHGKTLVYSPFWGGSYTPANIDDTVYNKICLECHTQTSGGPYTTTGAPFARTHSSLATDNGYGNWTRECRDCHNPHYQKQSYYKIADSSNLYLARGTITSCGAYDSINNETTLTYSGITYKTGWDATKLLEKTGSYRRTMLVPNVGKLGFNYPITEIAGTTIKVAGDATATYQYISPPTTFAVMYGQYIKDLINVGGTNKTVKLLDRTGTKSFADGDATYDGVCEVCHTLTTYHKNSSAGDHTHYAATNCTTCHLHADGFKGAGCNACHGFPPPPLATTPLPTGSTTAGAHVLHATTKGYACAKCHYNSAGGSGTHNNNIITLGFVNLLGAYTGGSYDGQATANYQSSDAGTTVSKLGSKTCGSIYCHSTGQSTTNGNDPTPTYVAPVWDTPSTGACGSCHKVTEASGLTSGSHAAHLGTVGVNGCGDCHTGAANDASVYNSTNHVNGLINAAGGYNKGGTPGNGYGTCNATLCHDNGTGTPAVTPTWGTAAAACAACHAAEPVTASHTKHLSTTQYTKAVCGDCHDAAVKSTTAPAQHLDGNLDVYDVAAGDLGYPIDEPKGGAPYKTCTTAYCHSTGQSTTDGNSSTPTYATATWGGTAACGTCHKVTEASGLTSGSHGQHLGTTGVNGCGDCHTNAANDASAYNSTAHVDRLINVAVGLTYSAGSSASPGNGYGTCSTLCHDNGLGVPVVTPTWGATVAACASCHAAEPATGSHTKHLAALSAPADPLDTWYLRDSNTTSQLREFTFGKNMFISVGLNGTIITSPDGVTPWTVRRTGTENLGGVAYGNGRFVVVGYGGTILTSEDGVTWTPRTGATTADLERVGFGNGVFVAVGDARTIQTSPDGITWTLQESGGANPEYGIAYGNGVWIAAGANSRIWRSIDNGENWTRISPDIGIPGLPNTTEFRRVAFGNNMFVAVGDTNQGGLTHGVIVTSPTGAAGTWTMRTVPAGTVFLRGARYGDGSFVVTGYGGTILTSTDGVTWVSRNSGVTSDLRGVGFGNSTFVTGGDNGVILQSSTGTKYATAECGDCHDNAVKSTTAPAQHLDTNIDVYDVSASDLGYPADKAKGSAYSNCSSAYCHSPGQNNTGGALGAGDYQTVAWGGLVVCGECHKVTEATGLTSGSHGQHLGATGVAGCGDCHTNAANDASAYNSTAHVDRSISVAAGVSYTAGGLPGNGYGICSTASCHDDGTGIPAVTPTWGTAAAACAACHAAEPATASHTKHLSTTQYTKAVCGDCHDAAVKSTTAPAQHLDGNLDVYDVAAGDLGYPIDEPKGGAPYKTCTTAYCHSTGQSTTNGNSATPTYATATWGGTAACGTCHKVTEASGLTSGSHGQHLGTTGVNGCGDCHTDAANDASAYNSTSHVNRLIDAAGGYNKGGAPGNGYGTCNTASCHDDGTGNPAVTPTWGTAAAACAACHAAAPATGSHTKHLTTTDFVQAVCGDCHDGTVQGTTVPVTHLDGNLDVYDAAAGDLGYPQNVAKGGAPYDSCTTAYCHSNGSGTYKSATWGGTSTGCNFCHDALPTTNAHLKHVATAATTYGSTTVSSTAGSYDFGCGNCHPTDKTTYHANGTVDISLDPADGGTLKSKNDATANKTGSGATTVCNKIYCHSNGADGGNRAYKATPTWSSTFGANKCGQCHDNPPQYAGQSHYNATGFMSKEGGHLAGIHFDNIYNGTNGLATSGTGNTNSHGNSAYSTTITCYICHNGEVSSATIDTYALNNLGSSSMKCGNCHTGATPTPLQNGAITNKSLHVNAVKNVTIAPAFTMKSKAQLRTSSLPSGWTRNVGYKAAGAYDSATINSSDWNSGDKTCTTACHNGQTVIWGDTNVTCNSCHTELP